MDSIIREESSIAESSLFNHRSVYKAPSTNHDPIKLEQLEIAVDKPHNSKVLHFNMAPKTKLPSTTKHSSSNHKYAGNSELDKMLNFSKKPEELKSGSKTPSGKKTLNFSLKLTGTKKNISFASSDPKKLMLVTNSNLPTDVYSPHVFLLVKALS